VAGEVFAKRAFRCFLSHAHADKAIVDRIYEWLTRNCGYRIWYDAVNFPTGLVASSLGGAIQECQGAIIVLSATSIASGWVEQEWNMAIEQKMRFPDFTIVLLRLDECTPPVELRSRKWIDIRSDFSADGAIQMIEAFHSKETDPTTIGRRQIYLSRGNRPNEINLSNVLCDQLKQNSIRIVRDAPDQSTFDPERVRQIMAGCGAIAAFVPHRGGGGTSKYIIKEIEIAQALGIASTIFIDPAVDASRIDGLEPASICKIDLNSDGDEFANEIIAQLSEASLEPVKPAHCFMGHSFKHEQSSYWPVARRALQVATGLPCISGDEVLGGDVQEQIANRIREAVFCIFDITDDRLNSCIEAGIALGGRANFELVCKVPRRRPPFMFRHRQVFFYDTHADLVGLLTRLAYPYRCVIA
jgi:TIR domain